jgi:hypothetical protein
VTGLPRGITTARGTRSDTDQSVPRQVTPSGGPGRRGCHQSDEQKTWKHPKSCR